MGQMKLMTGVDSVVRNGDDRNRKMDEKGVGIKMSGLNGWVCRNKDNYGMMGLLYSRLWRETNVH